MQTVASSRYRSSLAETTIMTVMAVSFVTAIISGIFLHSAYAEGDFVRVDILRACHATSAVVAIILGIVHMWNNRGWYRRLCTTRSLAWGMRAQSRLLSLQTILFAVMVVTGVALGFGARGALGFHQGCGLIFALLVLVHMGARLTSRRQ